MYPFIQPEINSVQFIIFKNFLVGDGLSGTFFGSNLNILCPLKIRPNMLYM